MRIPRIFHPQLLSANSRVKLDDNATRHVAKVLRLGRGAELILFDGSGAEYPATIVELEKRQVTAATRERRDINLESPLQITLAQGISKGDRMDYTIQKAVELGVKRIVPLNTERSMVNLKGDRLEKKFMHWNGVIISACEQCGRNNLPELLPQQNFDTWLQRGIQGAGLVLDHRAKKTINSLEMCDELTLLIGPEGGLSEQERERALKTGYQGLCLGPRVLRTETAALTALAALQSRWGDLR